IQGDVVAHSMGGVITRTMPLLTRFMSDPAFPTFNQGSIHKVVTISAPHLGTPLANLLLDPTADCTREILASGGNFAFTSVTLSNSSVNGAVGDLQSGSQALNAIAQTGPHPLPTALVFGVYTKFASLDCTVNMFGIPCPACYIRSKCGSNGDVLGAKLNSTGWPLIFGSAGNNQNDAVVGQTSQLHGMSANSGSVCTGCLHSPGMKQLSFTGPTLLDSSQVVNQVIKLLNTSYTQSAFSSLNP